MYFEEKAIMDGANFLSVNRLSESKFINMVIRSFDVHGTKGYI